MQPHKPVRFSLALGPTVTACLLLALGACKAPEPSVSGVPLPNGAAPSAVPSEDDADAVAGRDADANPGDDDAVRYKAHIDALQETIGDEFTIILEPPFVVIGDESPDVVKSRAEGTVRWATKHLKQDYFAEDPVEIIDIWLFANEESYVRNAMAFWGEEPGTPYGYYSEDHRVLVMNIATGGGTLVHEMVHPFMEANFPDCPAWFNEGLASLYEQSASRSGHIVGLTNWRLAGLQESIGDGSVPAFETLMNTTTAEFYNRDPGTNYAQARYLLYFLQEQGLLHQFYEEFRANVQDDPGGIDTLRSVLGREDLVTFQNEWEDYVITLDYP